MGDGTYGIVWKEINRSTNETIFSLPYTLETTSNLALVYHTSMAIQYQSCPAVI